MKDQVHIRNAEAAHLARVLARQTGKTISAIVLDALRQYRSRPRASGERQRERVARWRRLLHEDSAQGVAVPESPIEVLYDETTGLPG